MSISTATVDCATVVTGIEVWFIMVEVGFFFDEEFFDCVRINELKD
jgi:hypothetical protein